MNGRRSSVQRVALALLVASSLAGCGVPGDQLVFRPARDLGFVSPDYGADVSLPLTVSWQAAGPHTLPPGGAYGVFIDSTPQPPGKSIWEKVDGGIGCANTKRCRTPVKLRAQGAAFTQKPVYVLDLFDFGNEDRLGRHRVTVVVLDRQLRRVDENAYTVAFRVTSTSTSSAPS